MKQSADWFKKKKRKKKKAL